MKVGFHIHPFAMDVPGGGEVQLLEYVRLLRERGVDVWLHNMWQPEYRSLDIFHHFHLLSGGLATLDYIRRLEIPIILNTNIWFDDTNFPSVNVEEIRAYLATTDRFIANSHAEIANIAEYIGVDVSHGRVVYNGVRRHFSEPVDTRVFSELLPFTGRYILNIGNVEPRKNQLRLSLAARELGIPVVVLGGVRDQTYLRECKQAYDGFHYFGPQDHQGPILHAALHHAQVFALPSTFETPGLAALEAAVAGCQVVVTNGGSTREYFQDYVTYVDPSSISDIAEGLEKAFQQKARASELQHHVLTRFSWENVSSDLLAHYHELLA